MPKVIGSPDGYVLIDTEMPTDNVQEGAEEIKEELQEIGAETQKAAKKIEEAMDDAGAAAEKTADTFRSEGSAIEDILFDTSKTAKQKAAEIASEYRKQGMNQSDAFKKAWEDIKRASGKGTDKVKDDIEDIGDTSEKTSGKLKDIFGAMLGASTIGDLAANAIEKVADALKQFVAESIEAAANMAAENAQFEQTFKGLEDTATKSLNKVAKSAKVSASRMKQSYTKNFAFIKSIGGSTEEALSLTERAMAAAADSAAYYDRTLEETTETLQSFLKGNYENDAALGIAATETTRNAKANELYAMSFDKLSEAQKVDVLLAMVEAGNQASGALGQAAREADSWANVTGEAEEAMRKLQAAVGEPALELLIPIIQSITKAINELVEETASKKLKNGLDDFVKSWEDAEKAFAETEKNVEANAIVAKHYIRRLKELEAAGLDTAKAQTEYKNVIELLNELMPELNLAIDEHTGLVNKDTEAIEASVEQLKKQALYEAAMARYNDILKAQAEAQLDVAEAERELIALRAREATLLGMYTEEQWKSIMVARSLAPEVAALRNELRQNWVEQSRLSVAITQGNQKIAESDAILSSYSDSLGLVAEQTNEATAQQDQMAQAVTNTTEAVESLKAEYDAAMTSARESIDSQIGYFDELATESDKSAKDIIENWKNQKQAFIDYSANLEKAVQLGLDETLVKQLSDGSEASMLILQSLVNDTDLSIEDINNTFSELSGARDNAAAQMALLQTDMEDTLAEMQETVESRWGDMADYVGQAIREMQAYINSLKGKTVKVGVSKETGTISEVTPNTASVSTYALPHLASGAVIPPNAPFMAVLGDQRHGTNIEAPLSTIQEAVAAVMGDYEGNMMAGFEATVNALGSLLEAVQNIEVGDTTIGAAASRYNRKMNIMNGGAV